MLKANKLHFYSNNNARKEICRIFKVLKSYTDTHRLSCANERKTQKSVIDIPWLSHTYYLKWNHGNVEKNYVNTTQ